MANRKALIGMALVAGGAALAAVTAPPDGGTQGELEPWHSFNSSDRSTYLDAWRARYPTSTLPERMADVAGQACFLCHQPSGKGDQGNCYREDLKRKLAAGMSIEQAILAIDGDDSDADGTPNGEEILRVRIDDPSQVGYNPGLIGPIGVSPCSASPGAPVTGQLETPPAACYADCDGSGGLDFFDFLCFQNAFAAADPYADCDASGSLDFFDFLCFQSEFAAGCP